MDFSSECALVVERSRDVAIEVGDGYISSLHFLIAISETGHFKPTDSESLPTNFDSLKFELHKGKLEVFPKDFYLTKDLESALKTCKFYAWMKRMKEVTPNEIVESMLNDRKSLAGNYLKELGFGVENFGELKANRRNFDVRKPMAIFGFEGFPKRVWVIKAFVWLFGI